MYNPIKMQVIYLMLGNECNFKCKYCIQDGEFKKTSLKKQIKIANKVYDYINDLIKMRPDNQEKIHLIFWGGEPLIYMDAIKSAVSHLGDSVTYGIISNGALLTDEIVNFLNEHNIAFTVSNDGPNTKKTRFVNVLENPSFCELFKKIKQRSVSSVISAYNQDFQVLKDYIYEKLGETNINFDILEPSETLPQEIFEINYEVFTKSLIKMTDQVMQDILTGKYTCERYFLTNFIEKIARGDENPNFFIDYFCNELHTSISLDIDGNIYTCHNSMRRVTNVDKNEETIIKDCAEDFKKINVLSFKKCNKCYIKKYCQGGCKIIQPHYKGIEECCELRRTIFAGVFYLIDKLNKYFENVDILEGEL